MEKYNLTQTGQEVQDILDNAIPQSDLAEEVERAQEAEQTLQGNIDAEATRAQGAEGTLQDNIDAEETRAKAAEKQNADDIDAIEEKIPSAASSENQLADKSFVNSSIATATATFRGTFNLVSDLHLTLDATEQQIATALALAIDTADNNDYCFLQVPTSVDTPTVIGSVDRYKFNGSSWAYEYTLNNSGYTQAQWNAINSGITIGDVTKLEALPTNAQLTTLLNGKQNVLTFDNVPTRNSDNPVKSSGVFNSIEAILALIPSAASVVNQLADKAFVNSSIATATATFRGTYNLVTDLDLTISATYSDIASALADVVSGADNNDYAFVQIPTSDATPTQIAKTVRFKFNGTSWEYEYDLNNSGYTAVQWAAINSGITAALVAKLNGLPTADALQLALNAITQDIDNLEAVVPTEATSSNQLADKAFVLNEILLATPAFKGQFTTLAQLQAVTGAKTGDMGIVRTKDHDGNEVFTFYQYKDDQWTYFYSLSYHPQDKPATTGLVGEAPYNGMGRVELPMNWVEGWPNDTWLYYPYNDIVYLMYYWNGLLYAPYNSGTQEGLGLDDNLVVKPLDYNIADIEQFVGQRYLPFIESSGVWTITKPDDSTITSTELNNTNIYKINDPTHLGINVLTQDMINRPNTIYVIQYDFTLGEDITIPENCVLEFEGGSISGVHTITGQNTCIEANTINIINVEVTLSGTWLVENILANWFIADNDSAMFNKAFTFAKDNLLALQEQHIYKWGTCTVTCINKPYNISSYLYVPMFVNFDGNGSMFIPASSLDGYFMFYCNCTPTSTPSDFPHSQSFIRNIYFDNKNNYDVSVMKVNDNRSIYDITAKQHNQLIYYTGYRDNRIIKNITRLLRREQNTFDPTITDQDTLARTCEIFVWLGDSTSIENVNDNCSIYINTGQVNIKHWINGVILVQGCYNVVLENLHIEKGAVVAATSNVVIKDSLIYPNSDYAKPIISKRGYAKTSFILDNVIFGALCNLTNYNTNFKDWYPVDGDCFITYKNVFGVIDNASSRTLMVQHRPNIFINPFECSFWGETRNQDNLSIPQDYPKDQWGKSYFFHPTIGNDAHIKLYLLVDTKRMLYKAITSNNKFNQDVGITVPSSLETVYSEYSPMSFAKGCIIRIEIGTTENTYTQYFDYGIGMFKETNIRIDKRDDKYCVGTADRYLLFDDIDYSNAYTEVLWYVRNGENIKAGLNSNTLPSPDLFNKGDELVTNDGIHYTKINSSWVDATGATV